MKIENKTGVALPLGALLSHKDSVIGEFPDIVLLANWAKSVNLQIIQLLPLNDTGTSSSPYNALSAFALHPIYISIENLLDENDKADTEIQNLLKKMHTSFKPKSGKRYDYSGIYKAKTEILRLIFNKKDAKSLEKEMENWISENEWVIPYAVFKNLKRAYNQASWKEWKKKDTKLSSPEIKRRWEADKKENLFYAWTAYTAHLQFQAAALAVRKAGVILKGDIPILVNEDSADAWQNTKIFNHTLRVGSPPEGEDLGQSWGFPSYVWKEMKKNHYKWWQTRLKSAASYYDAYRLDHILGFFRIWAVNERETTAYLGHTVPSSPITREALHSLSFSDERIRWLSSPHIPTKIIQDITWNYEEACEFLSRYATKIDNEELWLFKNEVKGDKDIYETPFENRDKDKIDRMKSALAAVWRDRCLVETAKDEFAFVWQYHKSTAWQSLNDGEKEALLRLKKENDEKENRIWEEESSEILSSLTKSTQMQPCGEDLGAEIECLPRVLLKNGIFSLRVIRWARKWKESGAPFIELNELPLNAVATSSVHDCSTLRIWWQEEQEARRLFVRTFPKYFVENPENQSEIEAKANEEFSEEKALAFLKTVSEAKCAWCIHPIADYLALDSRQCEENAQNERINVPGTVSDFNWTYRMSVEIKDLKANKKISAAIKEIADIHKRRK